MCTCLSFICLIHAIRTKKTMFQKLELSDMQVWNILFCLLNNVNLLTAIDTLMIYLGCSLKPHGHGNVADHCWATVPSTCLKSSMGQVSSMAEKLKSLLYLRAGTSNCKGMEEKNTYHIYPIITNAWIVGNPRIFLCIYF